MHVCGKSEESVGHFLAGRSGLTWREYRRKHDRMELRACWESCCKYGVKSAEGFFEEMPDEVKIIENGKSEIWLNGAFEATKQLNIIFQI